MLRAGGAALSAASYNRILGANDAIRLGVVGCGLRGKQVLATFVPNADVRLAALCDVWGDRVEEASQRVNAAADVMKFSDHRQMLEKGQVDAVLVATPDHWHREIAVDAMKAGKDVYCEKPLTLTIEEGPMMVKAARENNRICQVGMQQRSGATFLQAYEEYFKTKKLGKISLVRTWWNGTGAYLWQAPPALASKPSNLDWNRFLGRVKWRDWAPQQYWCFRNYLEFGGGQVTDLFTHWVDTAHHLMEQDNPISAVAAGGVYHFVDGRTSPDTINLLLEYPGNWTVTFEGTLLPGASGFGMIFFGSEGRLEIDRKGFAFTPAEKGAKPTVVKTTIDQTIPHVRNFLDCMKSRKTPNADVQIGHRSVQAAHLGNLAYAQKRRVRFDPVRERVLPLSE